MGRTIKMEIAAKKVFKEHKSLGQAFREAGYSKSTSIQPKAVTSTAGWQEIMQEYLPDSDIAKIHKQLLGKKEIVVVGKMLRETGQLHSDVVRAVDMAYKLKGSYAPEKYEHAIAESHIDEEIARTKAELKALGTSEREDNAGEPSPEIHTERQD